MNIDATSAELREVRVDLIDRNTENPRIVFRPGELDQLMESIRLYGVQVPISVYREARRYVLIDGERRWRCSIKLNRVMIPALVQEKPEPLTNLLLMFNIHAMREQWDLLTIALKLPRLIELITRELGSVPKDRELAERTGLKIAMVRRCKLLIDLPQVYKDTILDELRRPKPRQKLTEDFFIEMERALRTVERSMPDLLREKDSVRQVLIDKYRSGVITNIVHFRQVAKIARAERVAANKSNAHSVLRNLFDNNTYSIEDAYGDSVSGAYLERDIKTRVEGLLQRLQAVSPADLDSDLRASLLQLSERCRALLARE